MAHPTTSIGLFLIYGVVLLPVYVMLGGWLFGGNRDYRTVALALGYLVGFVVVIVVGLLALDIVITLVSRG